MANERSNFHMKTPHSVNADEEKAICAHPDCDQTAEFKAPHSPQNCRTYHQFCLEHVREYNAAWNFYAGMNDDAIEAEIRNDIIWRRPSWPLGSNSGANHKRLKDSMDLLGGIDTDSQIGRTTVTQIQSFGPAERDALSVLGLVAPITLVEVKLRYKTLAKKLHPDANGGDKGAEDRLKSVNYAYKILRNSEHLV